MENLTKQLTSKIVGYYSLPKTKSMNFGECLNHLQEIAEVKLPKNKFKKYLLASNKDNDLCEGQDCLILNGHVFDWKEFRYKRDEIIRAYLEYFDDESLEKISNTIEVLSKIPEMKVNN